MTTAQRHLKLAYWRRIVAWNRTKIDHYPMNSDRARYLARIEEALARIHDLEHPVAAKPTSISANGVALIKSFEGYIGHPYQDAVGVWTIGYGHTGADVHKMGALTEPQATALLKRDLDATYVPPVVKLGVPLSQNQFDALVSFVYNVGAGFLQRGHTMGDALAARDYKAAADAFLLYDMAGGKHLAGLTRRRRAERTLFLS